VSTTTASTLAPVSTWQLDAVHSTIGFEVPYLGGTFKGQFREVEAKLDVQESGASLTGSARVTSVDVKDENLAAHLQSPEFFDAERYPELELVARDVRLDGETASVDGEITIKGVTKPIELTGTVAPVITDAYGRERVGLNLSAAVDRTEFGLEWNLALPSGEPALGNEVTLVGELYFVKAA
jgi:polyisoprenoid-binding protein YceI